MERQATTAPLRARRSADHFRRTAKESGAKCSAVRAGRRFAFRVCEGGTGPPPPMDQSPNGFRQSSGYVQWGLIALCSGRIRPVVVEFVCSRHRTGYLALQTSYCKSGNSSVPSASCLHRINSILAKCPVESDTISRDVECDERHLFIEARYAATDGTSVSGVLRRCEIVSHYEFSTQAWFCEMEDVHHVQTSGPLWDKTSFRFACVVCLCASRPNILRGAFDVCARLRGGGGGRGAFATGE